MSKLNIGIIGGGIVGLALAYKLQLNNAKSKIILFEKENKVGSHQSGRNSGVLHCGLAYKTGSLKAKLAKSGIEQMTDFCIKHQIPHDICGKIVVASDESQIKHLDKVAEMGKKNGLLNLRFLNNSEIKIREPYVLAKKALLVPQEGIVDFKAVMYKLKQLVEDNGGEVKLSTNIKSIESKNNLEIVFDGINQWSFDLVINCTGLYSDKNYKKYTKRARPLRIIPFRGEYMMLKPEAKKLVNHLVYPAPDPKFPFLGVHFTRLINGERELGPNAVLAFKREGYKNTDISIKELMDTLSYKGFLKFISKNLKFSLNEFSSSIFLESFIKKAQMLIPEINSNMVVKGTAGVRAQAMNDSGELLMDFNIVKEKQQIHVLNAPSPGATASLAIADYIVENYLT